MRTRATLFKAMERQPVVSKAILSIGYDLSSQTLEIEFRSGRVYQYSQVDPSLFQWLMKSNDKGGLFNRLVRDRYPEREVSPAAEPQDLLAALRASLDTNEPK